MRALWGIGPVTEKRLLALGVTTVGELAAMSPESLERYLGTAAGRHLSELSRAIDDRPVVPEQEAKSIGHEETFSTDLWDPDDLQARLQRMVDASATALRRAERAARTVTVKLRFGDFTQITRSHTLDGPVDATPAIGAVAAALLDSVDLSRGVRLLGVSLSGLAAPGAGTQLRLDLDAAGAARQMPGRARGRDRPGRRRRRRDRPGRLPGGRAPPAVVGIGDRGGGRHPGAVRRDGGRPGLPRHPGGDQGAASGARPSGGRRDPGPAPAGSIGPGRERGAPAPGA